MTFFYGLWNPEDNTLQYFNAGHLFPYVRRTDGKLEVLEQSGLPLGAVMGFEQDLGWMPHVSRRQLHLFLGRHRRGRRLRPPPLRLLAPGSLPAPQPDQRPRSTRQTLVDQVWRFAGGPPDDDVTVLVAQVL